MKILPGIEFALIAHAKVGVGAFRGISTAGIENIVRKSAYDKCSTWVNRLHDLPLSLNSLVDRRLVFMP